MKLISAIIASSIIVGIVILSAYLSLYTLGWLIDTFGVAKGLGITLVVFFIVVGTKVIYEKDKS